MTRAPSWENLSGKKTLEVWKVGKNEGKKTLRLSKWWK